MKLFCAVVQSIDAPGLHDEFNTVCGSKAFCTCEAVTVGKNMQKR